MPDIDPERLYTLSEAARAIHRSVSAATIRNAVYAGRIGSVKVGRRRFVSGDQLLDYLGRMRCPAKVRDHALDCMDQTNATEPHPVADFAVTSGTSSGMKTTRNTNEQRALMSAQALLNVKPPSLPSSTTGPEHPVAPVIPIRF